MNNHLQTTHPKNSFNVTVEFSEDFKVVNATYDDGEEVEMNDVIKSHFQADIDFYAKGQEYPTMKKNTYIVKVLILTNGYEKTVTKLVCATNEDNAGRDALIGECHGDIDDGTAQWDGDCIHDLMDKFIYKVKRVTQVDDSDILILRKYLN